MDAPLAWRAHSKRGVASGVGNPAVTNGISNGFRVFANASWSKRGVFVYAISSFSIGQTHRFVIGVAARMRHFFL
jgi:hypothetical protein